MTEILRIPEHDPLVCGLDAYTGCDKCLDDMAWHRISDRAGEDGYLKLRQEQIKKERWQKRKQ